MKRPLISVIIPTYNRGYIISRSIESILNQTFQDFEIIVVDDGSTDNTQEIVKSFKDNRIKYIKLKKNGGVSVAINRGIYASNGRYIALQGSKNESMRTRLQEEIKVFNDNPKKLGAVYTGLLEINNGLSIYKFPKNLNKFNLDISKKLLEFKEDIFGGTFMIKKSCFDKVGLYDEYLKVLEDRDIIIRLSRKFLIKGIDKPLLKWYRINDSLTSNKNAFISSYKRILNKNFKFISSNKKIIADNYTIISYYYLLSGDKRNGLAYFKKACSTKLLNDLFPVYIKRILFLIIFDNKKFLKLKNLLNNFIVLFGKIKNENFND